MKLKTISVFMFLFVFGVVVAKAQAASKSRTQDTKEQLLSIQENLSADDGVEVIEPFNGTFQFTFTKGIKQAFTTDILKTIEENRKEDEQVTIVLSPYSKVIILSKNHIISPDFVPFAKSYVFEN